MSTAPLSRYCLSWSLIIQEYYRPIPSSYHSAKVTGGRSRPSRILLVPAPFMVYRSFPSWSEEAHHLLDIRHLQFLSRDSGHWILVERYRFIKN